MRTTITPQFPARYTLLETAGESLEDGISESVKAQEENSSNDVYTSRKAQIQFSPWMTHGVAFCLGALLSIAVFSAWNRPKTIRTCTELLSTYSPANEAVEYQTTTFNGSLFSDSIFRRPPSPEVDAAWDRISNTGLLSIRINTDELSKVGKSDRPSIVKFREEDGGGYAGTVEVFHQLHCVDMLRKGIYREYYEESDIAFQASPRILRAHLDHCIDIIRQNIMCAGDTGVVTYDWVQGWEVPLPDMNTVHQCRDFEKLLDWHDEHAVHIPRSSVMLLEGQVERLQQA